MAYQLRICRNGRTGTGASSDGGAASWTQRGIGGGGGGLNGDVVELFENCAQNRANRAKVTARTRVRRVARLESLVFVGGGGERSAPLRRER